MKKIFISLLYIMIASFAKAGIIEQVQVEETLRTRIESLLHIFDPQAKVVLNMEYKTYRGILPGTNIQAGNEHSFRPLNAETEDIKSVSVDVFSNLPELPPDAQELLYKMIPVKKSDIKLTINQLKLKPTVLPPSPINQDTLNSILTDSILLGGKILGLIAGCMLVLSGFFSLLMNRFSTTELRKQIETLNRSISEIALGSGFVPTSESEKSGAVVTTPEDSSKWQDPPLISLKELFSDAYWCKEDGYAHWLWKEISLQSKQQLIASLIFMKDYSNFFLDVKARKAFFHEHPYYLEPQNLSDVSQEDLISDVELNPSLWHTLSPMRQQNLPLTLEAKITALQSPLASNQDLSWSKKSSSRSLNYQPHFGDVSESDELAIFENPELVPQELRKHVLSLGWLALCDDTYLRDVLAKYDAKTLASVWVGPKQVLEKLERALPERKLKLLNNYRSKLIANRKSEAYRSLVEEGIRHVAS